jgi:hypothetical protein
MLKKKTKSIPLQKKEVFKHIAIIGVLSLFMVVIQAQIRPKQLRKDILKSQSAPEKQTPKNTKKKPAPKSPASMPAPKPLAPTVNPLDKKNVTLVYLEHSETWTFNQQFNYDAQMFKGNVRFRHDNALLYCDSALFYEKANSIDAFGM